MYDLLGYESLFEALQLDGIEAWPNFLARRCNEALSSQRNADYDGWVEAIDSLQVPDQCAAGFCTPTVTFSSVGVDPVVSPTSTVSRSSSPQTVHNRGALKSLMPWRKGPFHLNGLTIDTEWRSDLKWDRIADLVDWDAAQVLDVGCGNGYFGWRMLGAGAHQVVGLDPFLLYVMQHAAVRKFAGPLPNFVLPVGDDVLKDSPPHFDVVLSMGVLYHRASPIEHLLGLRRALKPGGRVVLETLVVEGDEQTALVPADRYAKMRNVWFLPSVKMLTRWLKRCRFDDIRHEDSTATTCEEQRATEWMEYESLADFIDPTDQSKTIEGHPAPLRATITATKR